MVSVGDLSQSAPYLVKWSGRRDSNPRHPAWEAGVLPLNYSRSLTLHLLHCAPYRHTMLCCTNCQFLRSWLSHTATIYLNTFCHKKQAPPFRVRSLLVQKIVRFSRMVRCAGAFQKAHAERPPVRFSLSRSNSIGSRIRSIFASLRSVHCMYRRTDV